MSGTDSISASAVIERLPSARFSVWDAGGLVSGAFAGIAGVLPALGVCPFCLVGLPCPVYALGTIPVIGG